MVLQKVIGDKEESMHPEDRRRVSRGFVRQASWLVDGPDFVKTAVSRPTFFTTPTCLLPSIVHATLTRGRS
jgi:hypothetical protein